MDTVILLIIESILIVAMLVIVCKLIYDIGKIKGMKQLLHLFNPEEVIPAMERIACDVFDDEDGRLKAKVAMDTLVIEFLEKL